MNAAAVRKAFEEGVARMERALAAGRRIAWLSLAASVVALTVAVCAVFIHVIHGVDPSQLGFAGGWPKNCHLSSRH